jgi:hypothetical protein
MFETSYHSLTSIINIDIDISRNQQFGTGTSEIYHELFTDPVMICLSMWFRLDPMGYFSGRKHRTKLGSLVSTFDLHLCTKYQVSRIVAEISEMSQPGKYCRDAIAILARLS